MESTDRLIGLGTKSVAVGAFIIGYVQWAPSRIAELLNSPTYIGYLISLQFGLLVVIVFSILYIISHLNEVQKEIEDNIDQSVNYYISNLDSINEEFLETLQDGDDDDAEEQPEEIATDGGSQPLDTHVQKPNGDPEVSQQNTADDEEEPRSETESLSRLTTTGRGMLVGIVVGIPLGLLYSLDATVIGGLLGALLGNEIEYQAIRRQAHQREPDTDYRTSSEGSKDKIFDILKNSRRRSTIRMVSQSDSPLTIEEIAERIAAQENDKARSQLTSDERQRVYITLYQLHLRKLSEEEIIEFDEESGVVRRGELFDPYLRSLHEYIPENDLGQRELDNCFHILQNARRRMVIETLEDVESPVSIGDLAERIASNETNKAIGQLTSSERKRVYTALYQAHLPKLADADVIDFDKHRGKVSRGDRFEDYLRASAGRRSPRRRWLNTNLEPLSEPIYYLFIGVTAIVILLGNVGELAVISNISANVWFAIYTALVFVPIIYRFTQNP
ncbi:DUF7344 domain-containing protein [Haloferax denitrificans]|uniref:DUF7344 domain-containing protein n=1 Tax=Haloferax denitrificans ATCC 35960 TaxID=662478 RepID=M0IYB5_9EURY|nr:hypothetical protein [Haloferax denitrificans]EMA00455.1 hypothetical protein C438_18410 [Haloferax denitrificans ATCC 35960]